MEIVTRTLVRMISDIGRMKWVSLFYLLGAFLFFISLILATYMKPVVELKNIEVEQAEIDLHKKKSEFLSLSNLPAEKVQELYEKTIEKEPDALRDPSPVWPFFKKWIIPIIVVLVASALSLLLVFVIFVKLREMYDSHSGRFQFKGLGMGSVAASVLGSSLTAIRYWSDLSQNQAIEYVFYSSFACLAFVAVLWTSGSVIYSILVYLVLIIVLFVVSGISRDSAFSFLSEYQDILSKNTVPDGSILLLGAVVPIVFVSVTVVLLLSRSARD